MGQYYHVRIRTKADTTNTRTALDWSREQLEQRLLVPYREGRPLVFRGETILPEELKQVLISTSEEPGEVTRQQLRREQELSSFISVGATGDAAVAARGQDVTDEFIMGPPGGGASTRSGTVKTSSTNPRAVFVVHGRDQKVSDGVFQFVRAIGLQPLEWSTAVAATGHPTPYIGDLLEHAFSIAQAIVVVLTPDDEARLRPLFQRPGDPPHEVDLTGQARPNVLFEAGMAIGRDPRRTIIVEVGYLRPFSDVEGRHVIRLDNSSPRRQEFAQRLEAAGCPVDLSGTQWHRVGDLTPTQEV